MKILKQDIEKKAEELKKLLPKLLIEIDGRRKAVYVNGIRFSYEEWMLLDLNKLKHPSFWGV
ncbi:hypothetical protein [Persephonella sp. KM09-Lau-8]|uniref:hypothetical protein n=1 Tax=Persephonella sp. KM09-Lau-8 TaxID=1158345 RepID=UPI000494EE45|nr:hypothetical protein [Persephonella sp. KM09-Lau-8]